MYEYRIVLKILDVKLEKLAVATKDDLSDNLEVGLKEHLAFMKENLPKLDGGGWEILSHQLTSLGSFLVVSFLIRRQK